MTNHRLLTALSLLLFPLGVSADVAKCTIDIQDVMSLTKYKIEESFTFNPGSGVGHRKHFTLPGHPYRCQLAFFDFATGTMLSCEFDEIGHHFVQSDRSGIDEDRVTNRLTFRYKSAFFDVETTCI